MSKSRRNATWQRWGAAALLSVTALAGVLPTHAAPWTNRFQFASPAFERVWSASDASVKNGSVARSYTWGPAPWFDYKEAYRQSPNGQRQVQYFDKARMEINDPSNTTQRGVTNGLLTVELVSGRVKTGDSTDFGDNIPRMPADVPVAGDGPNVNANAPTYASFKGVATVDNGYRDADRTGQNTGTTLDKVGNRTNNENLAKDPATKIVAYNTVTGHNVPQVFRDFIQNGPVDGLFAFGYPISDPYWIKAKVGGVEKDVFVQLYERRVVTYTPANPQAYKVEMGNVGQHYFQWRYPHLGQAWQQGGEYNYPVAFASMRGSNHWETYTADSNGNGVTQITNTSQETVPYSWRRSYGDGASPRLLTDSRRINGTRQIFSLNVANYNEIRQHTGNTDAQNYNPAVSPDGTIIAAITEQNGVRGISLTPFSRDQMYTFPAAPNSSECIYQSPTWRPDGSGLVFAHNCINGRFAIYRADIRYFSGPNDDYVPAELTNVQQIVGSSATHSFDVVFPRISPDGTKVVFTSNKAGGPNEIYVINLDGTGEQRITNNQFEDGAGTWSPDGKQLIFDSNRDGDFELYRVNLSDVNNVTQLTFNTVDDRWALWYQ